MLYTQSAMIVDSLFRREFIHWNLADCQDAITRDRSHSQLRFPDTNLPDLMHLGLLTS